MSKVTVITPVHNRPYFLEVAAMSIQQQTYKEWDHIIIDDGSTNPDTQRIINKVKNFPNVTVYRIENCGLGAARNYGIAKSKGEYILTLDDDDKWDSEFMEKAVEHLNQKPNTGVVTSWMNTFGSHRKIVKPLGGNVNNFLISNNSVHGMFRKKAWLEAGFYDENMFFQSYTDWDIWLRITALGFAVHVIEEPLFHYRIHSSSSMSQAAASKHLELFRYMVEKNKKIYTEHLLDCMVQFESKILDIRKYYTNRDVLYQLKKIIKFIIRKGN